MTSDALRDALASYQTGAYAAAAQAFHRLLAEAPENLVLLRLYGLSQVRSGEVAAGLPSLKEAHHRSPHDPLATLHLAIGLHAHGDLLAATALFREAASRVPGQSAPLINLSIVLLEQGEVAEALAVARQAVAIDQGAEALVAQARAAAAAGDLHTSLASYGAALRQRPEDADILAGEAVARYRAGDFAGAMQGLRQALAVAPSHILAAANLAALLGLRGEQTEAMERLRALLRRAPRSATVKLNLANLLLLDRDAEAALALLDGEAPLGREGLHWRAQRAAAPQMLGRHEEARGVLATIAGPLGDAEIRIRWLEILLAPPDDPNAADRRRRLASLADAESGALLEHRLIAHFDLATIASREKRPADAFAHWRRGHALLGRMQPFSRAAHSDLLAALREAYGADTLATRPTSEIDDPAPVFIVGMPRSGTTLAEQILSAHRMVHGGGERLAVHNLVRGLAGTALDRSGVAILAALDARRLTACATAFLAELHGAAPDKMMVTDKMPGNWLHLGFLGRLLPRARVIHCTRDPRDIGLSIFQRRFFGYHPYAHDLGDLGWAIAQHEAQMRHWQSIEAMPIATVALSDWIEDFGGTLGRLLSFLGLPPDPACARFHENDRRVATASRDQVRRPINADGIGRWRQYATHLEPMIAELRLAGLCE